MGWLRAHNELKAINLTVTEEITTKKNDLYLKSDFYTYLFKHESILNKEILTSIADKIENLSDSEYQILLASLPTLLKG